MRGHGRRRRVAGCASKASLGCTGRSTLAAAREQTKRSTATAPGIKEKGICYSADAAFSFLIFYRQRTIERCPVVDNSSTFFGDAD
jgi:hypothetical protein